METINAIRSNALFFRPDLLTETKPDLKTFIIESSYHQLKLLAKAERLKSIIEFFNVSLTVNTAA